MKKHVLHIAASVLAISLVAAPVQAACFADYKAKKTDPLKLHYGVIELYESSCDSTQSVADEITKRIGVGGWRLLNVMSVFGTEGLSERKDSAGPYYLRF